MRKKFLLGATILSVLAIGGTAVAHEVKHDSKITVRYSKAKDKFAGKVISQRDRCERERTVKIFRVEDDGRTLVETGTTDEDGTYAIPYEVLETADYYARVKREVLRKNENHTHLCRGDRSPTITVVVPPAH